MGHATRSKIRIAEYPIVTATIIVALVCQVLHGLFRPQPAPLWYSFLVTTVALTLISILIWQIVKMTRAAR